MWHQEWRETLDPGGMSTRSQNLENESAKIVSKASAAVVFAYKGTDMLKDKEGTLEVLTAPPTNLMHTAFLLVSKRLMKVQDTARPPILPGGPFPLAQKSLALGGPKPQAPHSGVTEHFYSKLPQSASQSNPNLISISVTFHRKRKLLSPK